MKSEVVQEEIRKIDNLCSKLEECYEDMVLNVESSFVNSHIQNTLITTFKEQKEVLSQFLEGAHDNIINNSNDDIVTIDLQSLSELVSEEVEGEEDDEDDMITYGYCDGDVRRKQWSNYKEEKRKIGKRTMTITLPKTDKKGKK